MASDQPRLAPYNEDARYILESSTGFNVGWHSFTERKRTRMLTLIETLETRRFQRILENFLVTRQLLENPSSFLVLTNENWNFH